MPETTGHRIRIPLYSDAFQCVVVGLLFLASVIVLTQFVLAVIRLATTGFGTDADAGIIWTAVSWMSGLAYLIVTALWIFWAIRLLRGRFIDIETVAPGSLRLVLPWREQRMTSAQVSSVTTSNLLGLQWVTIRALEDIPTFRFTVARSHPQSAEAIAEGLKTEFTVS